MTHKTVILVNALTNSLMYSMDNPDRKHPNDRASTTKSNVERVEKILRHAVQLARAQRLNEEARTGEEQRQEAIQCPPFLLRAVSFDGIHIPLPGCTFTSQLSYPEYHHQLTSEIFPQILEEAFEENHEFAFFKIRILEQHSTRVLL